MKNLLLIFVILLLSSCSKEQETVIDANGVATKRPVLWGTSISNNGELAEVVTQASIVYNDQSVLVGANRDNKRLLYSINSSDGEVE